MSAGSPGATFYLSFSRAGLVSQLWSEGDAAANEQRLAALVAQQVAFVKAYGAPVMFEELPGRKSTRVSDTLPGAVLTDEARWDEYVTWLMDRQRRLRGALAAVGGVPPEPEAGPNE